MSQPRIARTARLGTARARACCLIAVILLGSLLSGCGGGGPSTVGIGEFTALPAVICRNGKPMVTIGWNTSGSTVTIELRDAGGGTLETIGSFGARGHHDLPVGDLNPGQYWLNLKATASSLLDGTADRMITIIDGNAFWVEAGYLDPCENDDCSTFGPVTDSMPSSLFSPGVRLLQVQLTGWSENSTLDTYLTSVTVTHGPTVIVCGSKDECAKLPVEVQVPDAFGSPAPGDYEWNASFGHESTEPANVNVMKGTTLGMDVAYQFACEP